MGRAPIICVVVGVVMGWAEAVRAELVWERTEASVKVRPGETEAVAVYRFENRGRAVVAITEVRVSCGCTQAEVSKKVLRAGEKAEVRAKFLVGSRTGKQEATITVRTDDARESSAVLTMKVEIPPVATVTPTMLWWPPEDKAVKVVELIVTRDEPVKVVKVEPSHAALKWELKTVEEGRTYYVEVSPPPPEVGTLEYLDITTDAMVEGKAAVYRVFVKKVGGKRQGD